MAEPQKITRSPNLQATLLSWAETGAKVEPSSGRKASGLLAADLVTKEEFNWLWLEPYRWLRALFARYPDASEALFGSWFVDKGTGIWSDDAVGILQGFLSDGPAGTASLVTDLWLDPNGTGGVRVQVSVAKAFPAQFLANRDTYIYAPIDLIVPPTASEPELALLNVAVGFPPPATPAGFVLVWRVETDGAGIVDQEIFLPDFPVMKQVGFEIVSAALAMIAGDLDVGGEVETEDLTVNGNTILGDAPGDTLTVNATTTIAADVIANGISTFNDSLIATEDITFNGGVGNFLTASVNCTLGNSNLFSHTVNGDLTIGATAAETLSINSEIDLVLLAAGGIEGATGGNPVDLPEGANLPVGKSLICTDATVSGDVDSILSWFGLVDCKGRLNLGLTSTAVGDISRSGAGNLRYRDTASTKTVHTSPSGWFKGHGQAATATGPTVSLNTSNAVAPPVAGDVDVSASAWIQRNGVGDVTVSLIEVGGAGQIGTSQDITVPDDATEDYKTITFSRTRVTADTTPRVYQLFIDGNGQSVTCKALRITATSTS